MKYVLLALFGLAGLLTIYLAIWVSAASLQVLAAYLAASIAAFALAWVHKPWAAGAKWGWILVSLAMVFAIVSGPLDYLRLS